MHCEVFILHKALKLIFKKESKKMERWKSEGIIIASKRLLLVPLEETDAEEVLRWINNQEIVKNFQFFTGKVKVEEELRYIRKMKKSPGDLLLGIFIEGEELIGTCGLHEIDFNNHTARLGVIIGKKEHCHCHHRRVRACRGRGSHGPFRVRRCAGRSNDPGTRGAGGGISNRHRGP